MVGWIKHHKKCVLFILLIVLSYYQVLVKTGLPSDEEMIRHFYENKTEIETLVSSFRTFEEPKDKPYSHIVGWEMQESVQALLTKAGVERLGYINLGIWFPDPYSLATAQRVEHELSLAPYFSLEYQYGSLMVKFTPRYRYWVPNFIHGAVWKDFVYFPEPPRVENGYLLGPATVNGEQFREPVVASLNRLPANWWRSYECAYRQIEPQWFLQMCNGH